MYGQRIPQPEYRCVRDEITRILIVGGNAQDRAALRSVLERHSSEKYAFTERGTIGEAIELCLTEPPHCILLDDQLSDGTGLEFIKQLHERVPAAVCPIVMLTASGSEAIAVEAMKAGVQDCLVKGQTAPALMVRVIREAIYRVETQRLLTKQQAELQRLYNELHESQAQKDQILRELEAAKEAAGRAAAAPAPKSPKKKTAQRGAIPSRGKILVVEDHHDTAMVLARALRRRGFDVSTAHTVAAAIELFVAQHYDLLISDIGLPDGNGIDLLNTLNPLRRVPAIALSGYGMEHDLEKSHAAGFIEHLTKPVNWDSLCESIDRALTARS